MLDSSSSIGTEKMELSRKFTEQLTDHFRIGLNRTRMALVTFDSKPHLKWDLRESINNDEIKRRISELKYENAFGTKTGTQNIINFKAIKAFLIF